MKRTFFLLAASGALLLTSGPSAQAGGTTYRAPYERGPGGPAAPSRTQYSDVNTNTGQVTILSASLTPGAIGCAANGSYGYLRVNHPVTAAVGKVSVVYEKASITPFAWLKVNVRGVVNGVDTYLGSKQLRGQLVNDSGTLVADLDKAPDPGSTMTIDFGIESGSACPNADGGTATFPAVAVN